MLLLAAATLLTAMPVQSTDQDTPATPPKKERKICKDAQTSGTRMGSSRICKTASEWRGEADNAVEALDRQRNEATTPADAYTATGPLG